MYTASGNPSRAMDHLAGPVLPLVSPLAQSVSRTTSSLPTEPLPSLSNSVLANRRMTKGKHPATDGAGAAQDGQGYHHGHHHHHMDEDSLLHGISLDSLIKWVSACDPPGRMLWLTGAIPI